MAELYLIPLVHSFVEAEEDVIFRHFGADIDTLSDFGSKIQRAALMIHKVREGMPEAEARAFVKALTRKELDDSFDGNEPDEMNPDEPETEAGKAPATPAPEPDDSPGSALPQESSPPSTED